MIRYRGSYLLGAAAIVGVAGLVVAAEQLRDEETGRDERADAEMIADLGSCLRRHGADVVDDDITIANDGAIGLPEPGTGSATTELRDAMESCTQEPGWEPPAPSEEALEQALLGARAYVECLGAYGIDLPDPVVVDGQVYFGDEQQEELRSLDSEDPEIASALVECDPSSAG